MSEAGHWWPGDQIVMLTVWRERVWSGMPVTVVEDSPTRTALFMPAGTVWKAPFFPDGRPMRLPKGEFVLSGVRHPRNTLVLIEPGASHAVRAWWNSDFSEFTGWYVNLERPLQRYARGFHFLDETLDIVASPDLSEWHWKDEDELEEAVAMGVITPQRAAELRREGERVIEKMKHRRTPFNEGWENWRPNPAWPIPTLPEGWDIP